MLWSQHTKNISRSKDTTCVSETTILLTQISKHYKKFSYSLRKEIVGKCEFFVEKQYLLRKQNVGQNVENSAQVNVKAHVFSVSQQKVQLFPTIFNVAKHLQNTWLVVQNRRDKNKFSTKKFVGNFNFSYKKEIVENSCYLLRHDFVGNIFLPTTLFRREWSCFSTTLFCKYFYEIFPQSNVSFVYNLLNRG